MLKSPVIVNIVSCKLIFTRMQTLVIQIHITFLVSVMISGYECTLRQWHLGYAIQYPLTISTVTAARTYCLLSLA